jgi:hypothetical protein
MKTKHGIFFGFTVMLTAAIFTLAGCPTDGGGGSGSGSGSAPETYISTGTDGNRYELTITKAAAVKAVKGDNYRLIIFNIATGNQVGESTGTIESVSGATFTLKLNGSTTTFKVTVSEKKLTGILGSIPLNGGGTLDAPPALTSIPTETPGGNGGDNGNTSNDPETQENFFGIIPDFYEVYKDQDFPSEIIYHWQWNSVNKTDELGAILVQKGYHLTVTGPKETNSMRWHGTRAEMVWPGTGYYTVEYFDEQGNYWAKWYSKFPETNGPETQKDFFGIIPDVYEAYKDEIFLGRIKYQWIWDSVDKIDELGAILVQKGYHLTETRPKETSDARWHGTRIEMLSNYSQMYFLGYSDGQGNYWWKWYRKEYSK